MKMSSYFGVAHQKIIFEYTPYVSSNFLSRALNYFAILIFKKLSHGWNND